MTIIEFDEKNKYDADVYIEVGLMFSNEKVKQRLHVKESNINYDELVMDIRLIIQNLKKKQLEIENERLGL